MNPTIENSNQSRKKTKVLIIEDEMIAQTVIKMMLTTLNCEFELAGSGEEAIAKYNDSFDLVLMDIGLPDKRGTEVSKEIRQLQVNKRIPIVVLTAYSIDSVAIECNQAGVDDIYNKPFTQEDLRTIVTTYTQSNMDFS